MWNQPQAVSFTFHGKGPTSLSNHTFKVRLCADNSLYSSLVNARRLRPYSDTENREADHLPDAPPTQESDPTGPSIPASPSLDTPNPYGPCSLSKEDKQTSASEPELFEVEQILTTKHMNGNRHYMIKWKNYKDPIWEPEEEYFARHTKTGEIRKRSNATSAFHRKQ